MAQNNADDIMKLDQAQALAIVKDAKAPIFDRSIACERLALIGTAQSVPVLAALLSDAKMAHYARYALEPIPFPEVDAALRKALAKLTGNLRIGVMSSLGARRDAKAVDALAKLLSGTDVPTAGAAAVALGRIGGVKAAKSLESALRKAAPAVKPSFIDGALRCAERLKADGREQDAAALYKAAKG